MIRVNCQWNDQGTFCTNKEIKRSLFGLGSRYCIEHDVLNRRQCRLRKPRPKPIAPPSPPKPKINPVKPPIDKGSTIYSNYDIISDPLVKDLVSKVNTFIRHGYILLGRPFFVQNQYHQAIIRKTKKEKS